MTSMDGLNQSDLNTIVTTDNNCLTACANAKLDVPITLGSGFPAGSPVVVSSAPDIFGTSLSSSTAGGGQTVTLTISGDADTPNGVYSVTVSVGSGSTQDDITLIVEFTGETLAAPTLSTPANGSTGVSPNVVLSWNPVGNARSYDVQLAADENFDTILESRSNIPTTSAGFTDPLPGNTTFYWRIRGVSECGAGEWSSPFFFTTADISCAGAASTDVPVTISSDGTPTVRANLNVASSLVIESMEVILNVSHTFIGDLSATLTSPDGTTINLFNQISEGGCIGDNLSVIFSDEAAQTSADFENACSENIPSVAGTFQSAEALSIFNGENAVGNWILTVTDNFDFDGGAITDFEILFCETRPLSLQSFGANRSLNVYPNPVRGLLNLEASGNWTSDIDAMLLDATGRQLRTFRIANPAGTLTQIDLSGLSAGVYYLRLVNQGIERTERLVVMP
jgi:subtilisin-like proprotein convertase family protein